MHFRDIQTPKDASQSPPSKREWPCSAVAWLRCTSRKQECKSRSRKTATERIVASVRARRTVVERVPVPRFNLAVASKFRSCMLRPRFGLRVRSSNGSGFIVPVPEGNSREWSCGCHTFLPGPFTRTTHPSARSFAASSPSHWQQQG